MHFFKETNKQSEPILTQLPTVYITKYLKATNLWLLDKNIIFFICQLN